MFENDHFNALYDEYENRLYGFDRDFEEDYYEEDDYWDDPED